MFGWGLKEDPTSFCSSPCLAAVTFVDSIVSGSEQKRRFVFTQNGGGEATEGERGGALTAAQILVRQNEPFNINTCFCFAQIGHCAK